MAKILICTYSMYGAWFSIRLEDEGHNVDIYLDDKGHPNLKYVLSGLIKPPLRAKPSFDKYDLVIFDLTGRPQWAEECFRLNIPCIGDSDFCSEIEDNRLLGIEVMEECDINVPFYEVFDDISEAKRFIHKENKRFVFKPNGGQEQDTATTYVSKDADDLLRYLDKLGSLSKGAEFILQEVVQGTEISTEGYFNGEEFFFVNGTLEEKKLMNKNIGPATGCSGNLVWVYDQQNPPFVFREGLGKLKDYLQEIDFRGMIDLNSIVSDTKLFGLEWTPRFGYDASATIFACISSEIGDFLGAIAIGSRPDIRVTNNFAAGIRLSIPPYPTETEDEKLLRSEVPIIGIEEDDISKNCFLYDCMGDNNTELHTVGVSGFIGVPIQADGNIQTAFGRLGERIKKIEIPDLQYRTDIEECCIKRYSILSRQGWLR
jgi:phosphoribosylamine---glycine ligase